jgi:hypothetical protein
MKKIYLSLLALASIFTVSAQEATGSKGVFSGVYESAPTPFTYNTASKSSTAIVAVVDTINYFFNKNYYKNTTANKLSFWTVSVTPSGSYTSATHYVSGGAVFLNHGGPQAVFGAQGIVLRQASSPSTMVPVRFSIYNVAGGLPAGAALSSFTAGVSTSTAGVWIGGSFPTTVICVSDYAIMMENASTNTLDAISIFLNNASIPTSTAPVNERYGEGLGIIGKQNGSFALSTGYFNSADTDWETIVSPWTGYTVTANNTASTYSTCNTSSVTFINTSSGAFSHRQYNLNKFFKAWPPFANTTDVATEVIDSVFTWILGDGSTLYGQNLSHAYANITNAVNNDQMVAKLQKMSDYSSPNVTSDFKSWTMTVTICNVGLTENSINTTVGLYPNPATDNVTVYVNNANQDTQLQVLNALGQVVISRNNLTEKNVLNTESLSKGVYFVRVGSGKNFSTSKLIISK